MRTAAVIAIATLARSPTTILPSQPGCSRWMTCSCCRTQRKPFFSPNPTPPDETAQTLEAIRTAKAPYLPLPPRLPYSPTSHPFKRHLEILSLSAISSSPAESWRIYLSLHPSLRRYIPDDIFRSLLAHQLSDDQPKQRWARARALVKFGQSCGMDLDSFGPDILEGILNAGYGEEGDMPMEKVWESLKRSRKDMSVVALGTRRAWLRYNMQSLEEWKQRKWILKQKYPYSLQLPHEVVRDLVDCRAGNGTEDLLGMLLLRDMSDREAALRAAIHCWNRRVDIAETTMETIMSDLIKERSRSALSDLVGEICRNLPSRTTSQVLEVLSSILDRMPSTRALRLLPSAPSYELISIGMEILAEDSIDFDTLLKLCERTRDESLLNATAAQIHRAPETIIIRFADLLLPDESSHHVLESLVPYPHAYPSIRRAYSVARSSGYTWNKDNLVIWRTIFHRAISPKVRHLHFASRLYADLLSDGIKPKSRDMLAMIRSIGMSKNASRPILLERHLRDHIEIYPNKRPDLVAAVVDGLTYQKSSDDALLAWTLVKRLQTELPSDQAIRVIRLLAQSPKSLHRQAMLEIHAATPTRDISDIVIASLILNGKTSPTRSELSHDQALALAGTIFRNMAAKQIPPSSKCVSVLVRGLVESDKLDNAISLVKIAVKCELTIRSSTIGRLMVRLAQANRYDDADEVERIWRTHDGYDRAVVGARVLMDIRRGREVDLGEVERRTGWRGSKPFTTYLRKLEAANFLDESEVAIEADMAEQRDPGRLRRPRTDSAEEGVRFDMAAVGCAAL